MRNVNEAKAALRQRVMNSFALNVRQAESACCKIMTKRGNWRGQSQNQVTRRHVGKHIGKCFFTQYHSCHTYILESTQRSSRAHENNTTATPLHLSHNAIARAIYLLHER